MAGEFHLPYHEEMKKKLAIRKPFPPIPTNHHAQFLPNLRPR